MTHLASLMLCYIPFITAVKKLSLVLMSLDIIG